MQHTTEQPGSTRLSDCNHPKSSRFQGLRTQPPRSRQSQVAHNNAKTCLMFYCTAVASIELYISRAQRSVAGFCSCQRVALMSTTTTCVLRAQERTSLCLRILRHHFETFNRYRANRGFLHSLVTSKRQQPKCYLWNNSEVDGRSGQALENREGRKNQQENICFADLQPSATAPSFFC